MNDSNSPLILPGDWEYELAVASQLPTDWQQLANQTGGDYGFVVDLETGLLRCEDTRGIREYVEGGEYDERLLQVSDLDAMD